MKINKIIETLIDIIQISLKNKRVELIILMVLIIYMSCINKISVIKNIWLACNTAQHNFVFNMVGKQALQY